MIQVVGICDVCNHKYIVNVNGVNYDGELRLSNGKERNVLYMCPSCADEVCDYIMQLKKENYNS